MNRSPESSLTRLAPLDGLERVAHRGDALTALELLILTIAGALAACFVAFFSTPLQIPGHAILKATLPIACGVALAPRTWSGTIAGSSAAITSALLLLFGMGHLQPAAMTSLLLVGPAFDLASRG